MKNVFILLVATVSLSSCATRKRNFSTSETVTKSEKTTGVAEQSSKDSSALSSELVLESAIVTHSVISYDGAAGDSLTITQYGGTGKVQARTVISGKGKATLEKSSSKTSAAALQIESKSSNTATVSAASERIATEQNQSTTQGSVSKVGFTVGFSIWIFLVIIVGVLYLLNRWFKWIPLLA